MAMFSTVVVDGKQIQFKTGGDDCDTYQVGDVVKWWVDKDIAYRGGLLDGIYPGESGEWRKNMQSWWVCIKDHRIVEVAEWLRSDDESEPHIQQYEDLLAKHSLSREHPKDLWTEAAWAKYGEHQLLLQEQNARDEAAGLSPASVYMRNKLREPGFARQIFMADSEPKELKRDDGVVLRKGQTYRHFTRLVVLERIYEHGYVGVAHPLGTHKVIPATELVVEEQNG